MSEASEKIPFRTTWPALVIILAATLGSGAAVATLTHPDAAVYAELVKPSFAPPGWVFPAAWTALYAMMGTALWFMLRAKGSGGALITLYAVQLAVSLMWPVLFFTLRAYGLALLWLLILLALIFLLMDRAFHRSKLAGWLLVPYALWVAFAGVLNFMIAQMNP